jgi:hypothetical protein
MAGLAPANRQSAGSMAEGGELGNDRSRHVEQWHQLDDASKQALLRPERGAAVVAKGSFGSWAAVRGCL